MLRSQLHQLQKLASTNVFKHLGVSNACNRSVPEVASGCASFQTRGIHLSRNDRSDDSEAKTPPPEGSTMKKKKKRNRKKAESQEKMETFKNKNKDLVSAAEQVEQALPSSSASDLVSRLFSHMDRGGYSSTNPQPRPRSVIDHLTEKPVTTRSAKGSLLSSLKVTGGNKKDQQENFGEMDIGEMQSQMIIAERRRQVLPPRPQRTKQAIKSGETMTFSLSNAERLNIFDAEKVKKAVKERESMPAKPLGLGLYEQRREEHLKIALGGLQNVYEEQIELTKQGKMWHFPVNNEQYMDEERKYGFHEHIFLERHLAGRFPETGPIRRFMELVCVGLGQNSWMTVPEKLKLIQWYSDYFKEKQDILERELGEVGVMPEEAEKLI